MAWPTEQITVLSGCLDEGSGVIAVVSSSSSGTVGIASSVVDSFSVSSRGFGSSVM